MSNALYALLLRAVGWALPAGAATGPAASQPSASEATALPAFMLTLFALGTCVLFVWGVRRMAHPETLSLRRSPGRPNRLGPVHVVLAFVILVLAQAAVGDLCLRAAARSAGGKADEALKGRYLLVGRAVVSVVWLAAVLLLARGAFRHGLRRGMGLSGRRWLYDSLRGVLAYLTVLPICIGLGLLMEWLFAALQIEPNYHPVLLQLADLPPAWKLLAVFSTVVLAPLAEEIFFRGVLQSAVRQWSASPWGAVLAASAFFAAMHLDQPQALPSLFALAVAMGYNYERTGRLWAPVLIHAAFNAVNLAAWRGP